MDREIPKEVRDKERKKMLIKYGVIGVAGIVCIALLISFMRSSVNRKDLVFSEVDTGIIEVSVSASGKVVPAFEEIINSPINTRIVEVYRKGGDSVDVGTPILKLDLQSTETEYKKLLDEEQMKRYQLEQLKVNNNTYLSDLAMQVKISAMKLNRMEVELRNERYLDSLGSGTTDKVRQAELNFNTGKLELEQLRQQYANEKEVKAADLKVKELEFNIFAKSLAEMKRTLDDAQIRSPRKAILTYINNQVGAQVPQGTQVAVISDLSHFKVEGEIADTYGDRVAAGGRAIVKIGNEKLEGIVSSVTPLSKNGVISFTVQLVEDNNKRLRSGLKTDVYVMNAVKEDVMRIANASYYVGRGEYELFVQDSDNEIIKRKVQLGDSNFEYVEVVSGLQPGDKVVVSDMSNYKNKRKVKHIGSKRFGVQYLLKGLYAHGELLYFHTEVKNATHVPFDVDFVTFKIVDKKIVKRTAMQEQVIYPLRAFNYVTRVDGKKNERTVFALPKFTIPDGKKLVVEMYEKQGGRHQSFEVENEDLVRAETVNELKVR